MKQAARSPHSGAGSWASDSLRRDQWIPALLPLDRWPWSSARPRPPRSRARSWWWTGCLSPPRPEPPDERWCWSSLGLREHTHGAQTTGGPTGGEGKLREPPQPAGTHRRPATLKAAAVTNEETLGTHVVNRHNTVWKLIPTIFNYLCIFLFLFWVSRPTF